jgi:hypothetical protein
LFFSGEHIGICDIFTEKKKWKNIIEGSKRQQSRKGGDRMDGERKHYY